MSNNELNSGGMSIFTWTFLLFLGLKLAHLIDWSWWWVTAPIWIPIAIILFVGILSMIVGALAIYFSPKGK